MKLKRFGATRVRKGATGGNKSYPGPNVARLSPELFPSAVRRFDGLKQRGNGDLQRRGEPLDALQREIASAPFDI